MSAEHPPPDRQPAGHTARRAALGGHGTADAPPATWLSANPRASRPTQPLWLGARRSPDHGRPSASGAPHSNNERLVHIEKASACKRRSRGDARGATGGERNARRLTL